jgi:hypothetical protein
MISWVGDSKEAEDWLLEGWVRSGKAEFVRAAKPKIDEAGYWYVDGDHALWNSIAG